MSVILLSRGVPRSGGEITALAPVSTITFVSNGCVRMRRLGTERGHAGLVVQAFSVGALITTTLNPDLKLYFERKSSPRILGISSHKVPGALFDMSSVCLISRKVVLILPEGPKENQADDFRSFPKLKCAEVEQALP